MPTFVAVKMYYSLGILLVAAVLAAEATLLRYNRNLQLFDQCVYVGLQCSAASNSVCAIIPPSSHQLERIKRDAEYENNNDNSGNDDNNNNSNNNSDNTEERPRYESYRVINRKTKYLPTIYKNTKKTRIINSEKNLYRNINTHSRIDVHQNVVQKKVFIHTVDNIHKDLTVNHVNVNHHTDVIKHVQPYLDKLYITRKQDIIQPYEKTVITRTTSKSVKDVVHPVIVKNDYKSERLHTIREPVRDLGVVELNNNNNHHRNRNSDNDNDGNNNNNAYELEDRAAPEAPANSNAASDETMARFKRETEVHYEAYCVCPFNLVPNAERKVCVCPHAGQTQQNDGFCA